MTKGRNAAKAFTSTRGVRFAAARTQRERGQAAERVNGTRRTLLVVAVTDVLDDDEVALTAGGFALAGGTDRDLWGSSNGKTFVQRFVKGGA